MVVTVHDDFDLLDDWIDVYGAQRAEGDVEGAARTRSRIHELVEQLHGKYQIAINRL